MALDANGKPIKRIADAPPTGEARAKAATTALLRASIARTLGQPEHFEAASDPAGAHPVRPLGEAAADRALGGGFPLAGLSEIRVAQTREAGTGAGFALALAVLLGAARHRPVLWIGEAPALAEAGLFYRPGLAGYGLDPDALVVVGARRFTEALWAGEEAARSRALTLAVLEVRGNPPALALSGTRRLHLRAKEAGRPFVLLRQNGAPEATAALLRLCVAPAAAAPVPDLAALADVIGHPAFAVAVEKSRAGRRARFCLEWNPHERRFVALPGAQPLSGADPAEARDRPDPAREPWPRVADRGVRRRSA